MDPESVQIDPFRHVGTKPLGKGNSEVWQVESKHDGQVYARKEFKSNGNNENGIRGKIKEEVENISRCRHHHVIEFWGSHHVTSTGMFGILLRPVAHMSLKQFFDRFSLLKNDQPERLQARKTMCRWPPCLFYALAYIHDRGVRHKDIKPENILIKDDQVYFADFGTSKNFCDSTTSKTGESNLHTWRYVAPEIDQGERRGRAADVWALGCCVLQICTLATGQNSIADLDDHLRRDGGGQSPPFCQSPYQVLDWILLLGASGQGEDVEFERNVQKMLQLTFLMLDPNPSKRVTAQQLVDMLAQLRSKYFNPIKQLACDRCRDISGVPLHNMPLHSVFKEADNGGMYTPSHADLQSDTQNLWEEVKRRWLQSHIWWNLRP
ncbi:hypothetical protein ABKA04_004458 [Annulohypoxylon sp. FPYF3050]